MTTKRHELRLNICRTCSKFLSRPEIKPTGFVRFIRNISHTLRWSPDPSILVASSAACKRNRINVGPFRQSFHHTHSARIDFKGALQELESDCETLLSENHLPTEEEVEKFLTKCINAATGLTPKSRSPTPSKDELTSALLAIGGVKLDRGISKASQEAQRMNNYLSKLVYSLIKHRNIFISTKLLQAYVTIQAKLGRPETFPEIFKLFTHKPIPIQNTSPLRYSKQNPNSFKSAIPAEVAKIALQTAIEAKKLVIALDIIETVYTSKAFKAAKLVHRALLPTSVIAFTPYAIYSLASRFAHWQNSMETASATTTAFLGIVSYVGLTGVVALVAITTSNDQMDRVTWAPGVPLLQRWMREEERAAIDQVAGAWGFSESWRRGEEEGEEWDLIKEWVSRRAMVLDKVELMEGMS